MRGRWWPAGDPAPLNRELRAAPGDIPSRGGAGDPGEDPGQRSLSDGFSTNASEPLSWSRRGWGDDIWVGRGGSRPEGFPPSSPLARVPLSAESRRIHGQKPPPRLRLRGWLPNAESRPAATARVPSQNAPNPGPPPPGRSLAYPGHPAPSVPAQEVRTRRGEPLTSWRRTHRGTVGQILMERAFRMGEMWREGWDRRGASHLGQKAPQVQGRTRSPRVKQRLCLLTLLSFNFHRSGQRAYQVPAPERPSGSKGEQNRAAAGAGDKLEDPRPGRAG